MEIAETPAAPATMKKNSGSKVPLAQAAAHTAQFDALFAFDDSVAQTLVSEPNAEVTHGIAPSPKLRAEPGEQNKKFSSAASIDRIDTMFVIPVAQTGVPPQSINVLTSTTSESRDGDLLGIAGAELRVEGDRARTQLLPIPAQFSSGASALSFPIDVSDDKAETLVGGIFDGPETPQEGEMFVKTERGGAKKSPLDSASSSASDDLKTFALDEPGGRNETAARSTEKIQFAASPIDLIVSRAVEFNGSTSTTPARMEPFGADQSNPAFAVLSSNNVDENSFELRLDPPELGPVRIELKHLENGVLKAVVTAERPDTLDLLRRHVDIFRAEVSELGFGELDLHFASHGQGDGAPSSKDKPVAGAASRSFEVSFDVNSSQFVPLTSGMDIWV